MPVKVFLKGTSTGKRNQRKIRIDPKEKREPTRQKLLDMPEGAKLIGAGAATIALAGAAVGIGNAPSSSIHSVARNPSLAKQLSGHAISGFASTEAIASPASMMAFSILSVFRWSWGRSKEMELSRLKLLLHPYLFRGPQLLGIGLHSGGKGSGGGPLPLLGYHCHRHQLIDRCQNGERRTTPSQEDQKKLAARQLKVRRCDQRAGAAYPARRLAKHVVRRRFARFNGTVNEGCASANRDRINLNGGGQCHESTGSSSMFGSPSSVPPAHQLAQRLSVYCPIKMNE
eukprot:Gb_33921 [translate_table: standard]